MCVVLLLDSMVGHKAAGATPSGVSTRKLLKIKLGADSSQGKAPQQQQPQTTANPSASSRHRQTGENKHLDVPLRRILETLRRRNPYRNQHTQHRDPERRRLPEKLHQLDAFKQFNNLPLNLSASTILPSPNQIREPSRTCLRLTGKFDKVARKSAGTGVYLLIVGHIVLAFRGRDYRLVFLQGIYRNSLLQMLFLRVKKILDDVSKGRS